MDLADALPDDPSTLKAMLLAERARAERLEQIIKELRRYRFGRRAETLPEDQMLLGLEDVEQIAASSEAEIEAAAPAERARRTARRRMNRGSLPAHLPRIEMVVDVEDHSCPCCRNALHRIGEDRSEMRTRDLGARGTGRRQEAVEIAEVSEVVGHGIGPLERLCLRNPDKSCGFRLADGRFRRSDGANRHRSRTPC